LSDISTPHHHLHLDTHLGVLHLRVNIDLTAPWTVIFGPSGSGKSTILRAACGLLPKAEPNLRQQDLPPHRRSIAYAPQGAILFPHLTVRQNISFATDATHNPSPHLIQEILDLFELSPLANRMPRDLSGGERQRVNLARALAVPQPKLLLLDEPFTGLDRNLRDTFLPRMQQRALQLRIPVLSVTHDVEEALLLNAEVIRLDQGAVIDQGPAPDVLAAERTSILQALGVH
jgi:molybdate transport system ATP-binding protein